MIAYEMPDTFCDDSGTVVHVLEDTEQLPNVGVILWSARRRQMRGFIIHRADRDRLGFHVLATALEEMLRDDR